MGMGMRGSIIVKDWGRGVRSMEMTGVQDWG